jgi:copper(I)-binding protein
MERLGFVLAMLFGAMAAGCGPERGVTVEGAWVRAPAPTMDTTGAYLTIRNEGPADALVGVRAEAATAAELHEMTHEGEVMRMKRVDRIPVAGGGETLLQPGGLHVMLIGLKRPLEAGEEVHLTLTFEKAGEVQVAAEVRRGDEGGHQHH